MRIIDMPDGRELDALVAEKVMHWHRAGNDWVSADGENMRDIEWLANDDEPWSPSTDIAAAWQVVEYLRTQGLRPGLSSNDKVWYCGVSKDVYKQAGYAIAETAPLAICRSALLAVGVTETQQGAGLPSSNEIQM